MRLEQTTAQALRCGDQEEKHMPKVAPISDKSQVATEHGDVYDAVLKVFGSIRGPNSILLHDPPLAKLSLELGNFFRYDSVVESPMKELAIITGTREKDCLYVWAAQVAAGQRAGLRDEALAVVKERREDLSALTEEERDIVTYVRQLVRKNRVEEGIFNTLKDRYGLQWLIEMTTVVGYYGMLAGVVNAFDVPPPADGDVLPVP
jgi:4-carboxymuconolactone decarboxylase